MESGIYRENILDHYKNPRNTGEIGNPDIKFKEENPLCGDEITVTMKVEKGVIKDIKFVAKGCAISVASMSMLSDKIKGKGIKDVMKLGKEDVLEMLNVPIGTARTKCAVLGLETVKKGIENYKGK